MRSTTCSSPASSNGCPVRIFRLGDSVAVQHERFSRIEHGVDRPEGRSLEHAERDAGAAEPLVASVGRRISGGFWPAFT